MTCPKCGMRQWKYDEVTLTCKNGHRFKVGRRPIRFNPFIVVPASVGATLALEFVVRSLT